MATRISWKEQKSALWAALERSLQGNYQSGARITIRVRKCSPRLSDYGGLVGACESIIDRLRDCGLIPDDDVKTIGKTDYDQIKVAHRKETGTYIRIEFNL
jgi:hypothetical protein